MSLTAHLTSNTIKHQFTDFYSPSGGLGSNFLINTNDLKYIFYTQGYKNNELV